MIRRLYDGYYDKENGVISRVRKKYISDDL
jgi:hypothetical protein